MKKIILNVACILIVSSLIAAPGTKLIQKFNETFPNAKSVKWSDDKAGYYVSFYQNEDFKKILYNKDGDFVCSWRYSNGEELPTNIIMKLNKKYGEAKILGVTELTTEGNSFYEVKLSKGPKLYCITLLTDGSITKENKFTNQDANTDAVNN
jgi:hypothetical protein